MKISGFDKLSLVDYKAYASAVIFTSGCNLRCPFCHNGGVVLGEENVSETEVLAYLTKRKGLLDAVCVSGGEPTLQPDLKDFLRKLKSLNYLVKLDTNGTNPTLLKEVIEENLVDYVAMDVKNGFSRYQETSGVKKLNLDDIKKSIGILLLSGIDHEFRTTLVQEFHTEQDIKELGKLLKGAKQLFLQQFVERDTCLKGGLSPVPLATAITYQAILSSSIQTVSLRGYK